MKALNSVYFLIFMALFQLLSLSAWSVEIPTKNLHCGGTWLGDPNRSIKEIKIDPIKQGVLITLNKNLDKLPKSIGITFFHADGKQTSFELESMDPANNVGQYHGTLSNDFTSTAPSFMGFQVKIPLGSDSHQVLESDKLNKVSQ